MEDSWRFQAAQGNICPTCRVSHFPFCPPPRQLYGNGFPSEAPSFHRPFQPPLPLPEHYGTLLPPRPLPPHPNPMAPRSLDPWSRYPLPEREPLGQPFFAPERLLSDDLSGRERFHKRMRVNDGFPGRSASPHGLDNYGVYPSMVSSEDERRLNLIRDHGRVQMSLPFDVDQRMNGVPVERYAYQRTGYARSGTDGDLYAVAPGVAGADDPVAPNSSFFSHENHALREDFCGGYTDLKGPVGFRDVDGFAPLTDKELQGRDWSASNTISSNVSNGGMDRELYGLSEGPSYPSRTYEYDGVPRQSLKNYMIHQKPADSKYNSFIEETVSNLQKQVPVSPPYSGSHGALEIRHHQHFRQTSVAERQQLHINGRQAPFGSNTGHYCHMNNIGHERMESKNEMHTHEIEGPPSVEPTAYSREESFGALNFQDHRVTSQFNAQTNQRGDYFVQSDHNMVASVEGQLQPSQPLLPALLHPFVGPTPTSTDPSVSHLQVPSLSTHLSTISPIPVGTISTPPPPPTISPNPVGLSFDVPHTIRGFSEAPATSDPYFHAGVREKLPPHIPQLSSKRLTEEGQIFPLKQALPEKKSIVNASDVFCNPHRATRPDHIVVILRGLPGSGKSYLAKALRDLEVDNGGSAPRIHCMDDYFMTEVEKVEESDGSKSSGSVKAKKQVSRKVMEYCYEPEMEEAYRASMLKAFKKTVEDGNFTFVIVDDRNLRVADFAQFWAIGKRSGYEVYLLEATYKDPTGCAARNVHDFTLDDIKGMSEKWEEAPPFYLRLEIQSLFRGDDLNENNIQEVDMDTEDMPSDERIVSEGHENKSPRQEASTGNNLGGSATTGERWFADGEDLGQARELGKSKWSKDFDDDNGVDETSGAMEKSNALSGLIQAYSKGGKSVYWGDQVERRGFSIGASRNKSDSSLIIGPGSGYNLKSNPVLEEETPVDTVDKNNTSASRKRSAFLEHIRAEREAFKAVFDRRRQRIRGLDDVDDE